MKKISDPVSLTPRQKQIMQLAAAGKTYKEIAISLDIGDETVQSHLKIVRMKLNVNNTISAVAVAISNGMIVC